MVIPLMQSSLWIVRNMQYIIAIIFGCTTVLCSVAAWYILKWLIPSPSFFVPFMGSRAKPKSTRKPRNVRSRSEPKPSPVERRVAIGYSARKRRPADGVIFISKLGATLSSMVGSTLILCSIASALICAYSLTERGCHTLRHIGLLEWLPWKEGLRCYKTRWDWVADILGEVFVALLNGHDLGTSGLEAM